MSQSIKDDDFITDQEETTVPDTEPIGKFKSSFINQVIALADEARNFLKGHETATKSMKEMYKGNFLNEELQKEIRSHSEKIDSICSTLTMLQDSEISRYIREKKTNLFRPPANIMELLINHKDILTEDELQTIATDHKDYELIQRRIKSIANERGFYLQTYPTVDAKIAIIEEITQKFISFIKYGMVGLEMALYIQMSLPEYDEMLTT